MIASATRADASAVIALWQVCGLTRPWNDPQADFELALSTESSTVLLARDGDVITGSVMVGFDGHRGWVYYLVSHPDYQRQGIGRMLISAAEDWLRERNCPKIQLMVRGENEPALGFYQALGYEVQDVMTLGRRIDRV